MSKYELSISERQKHTKIREGYCLLCERYGKLTFDHVPPQGASFLSEIEQFHITELLSEPKRNIKGIKSPNGGKFKTICNDCNNTVIGGKDDIIKKVCHDASEQILHIAGTTNPDYRIITVRTDILNYCRAMIGHILAATSCDECRKPPKETSYFTPLQNFVLGKSQDISETHDIHYWFYPYKKQISARFICYYENGAIYCMSLLYFYPIAFLVTQKGAPVYTNHSRKVDFTSNTLRFPATINRYIDFPFCELSGNKMYMLAAQQCTISYPR
ncbi:hypothetical protein C7446_1377 [Kushneria sinocarnis]|uniref:Uncharacterized protein n=1 Tax=Kushneria sinocarnis TaxID=595502 RepID=A0A420WYX2_9GAMM|nr:metal-binding protein [Kushneria sinocarnis]RKR06432.1 hypothetical protein C7446_1377 [Kushneria sinocarnis]